MATAEEQPVQLRVQVSCSVMPVLDGTRLNALCLVGWSLETRAEKGKRSSQLGPARRSGQTTTLTGHQDVCMSCTTWKRRGKWWHGRVVVQAD